MSDPLRGQSPPQPPSQSSTDGLVPEQATQRIWIGNPARGFASALPERSLLPAAEGPLFVDMHGFDIHGGVLQSSPAIGAKKISSSPTQALQGIALFGFYEVFGGTEFAVSVTSEAVFQYDGSSWTDLTPVYTTGTVSTTSDSAVVTGSGTTWSTDQIRADQPIDIENNGTYNIIQSVDSDTQITLTANYGSTLSGQSYTIKRTFQDTTRVFASIHNNNLYVSVSTYASDVDDLAYVLRYEDIWATTPSGQCEYLVANAAVTATVDVLSEVKHLRGHIVMNDSRILAPAHVDDGSTVIANRLYYCSVADQTVWVAEPGGFQDLVGIDGRISAISRLGEDFILHFSNGAFLASETGEVSPPLTYDISPYATRGATDPKAIKNTPVGQIYLSRAVTPDTSAESPEGALQVYLTDGRQSLPIGEAIFDRIDLPVTKTDTGPVTPANDPGGIDRWGTISMQTETHRSRCRIYIVTGFASGEYSTEEIAYYWDRGEWTRADWEGFIAAGPDEEPVVCASWTGAGTDHLYKLEMSPGTTDYLAAGGRNAAPYAHTDYYDANRPGFDKTWSQVLVWVSDGENQDVKCQLVARNGDTSDADTISYTSSANQKILHFSITPFSAEAAQLRLTADSAYSTPPKRSPLIHHIAIDFAVIGQVEASDGVTH